MLKILFIIILMLINRFYKLHKYIINSNYKFCSLSKAISKDDKPNNLSDKLVSKIINNQLVQDDENTKNKLLVNKAGFNVINQEKALSNTIIDYKDNKKAEMLLKDKRINFNDITTFEKDNIVEADFGIVKSADLISDLIKEEHTYLNNENLYNIKIVGKEVDLDEAEINLKSCAELKIEENKSNEANVQHFINSTIYKEEDSLYSDDGITIDESKSILQILMNNPLIMISIGLLIYYIYPRVWKKADWCNLSLRRNNDKILSIMTSIVESESNNELYKYINYRRSLYSNVRENFK